MASYLIEAYTPASAPLAPVEERARRAAAELSQSGVAVTYRGAIFVPEDELCFHLVDAPSPDAARQAAQRAGISPQRIVQTAS